MFVLPMPINTWNREGMGEGRVGVLRHDKNQQAHFEIQEIPYKHKKTVFTVLLCRWSEARSLPKEAVDSPSLEMTRCGLGQATLAEPAWAGWGPCGLQMSPQLQPFYDSATPACTLRERGAESDGISPNKILYNLNSHVGSVLIRTFHCDSSSQWLTPVN